MSREAEPGLVTGGTSSAPVAWAANRVAWARWNTSYTVPSVRETTNNPPFGSRWRSVMIPNPSANTSGALSFGTNLALLSSTRSCRPAESNRNPFRLPARSKSMSCPAPLPTIRSRA